MTIILITINQVSLRFHTVNRVTLDPLSRFLPRTSTRRSRLSWLLLVWTVLSKRLYTTRSQSYTWLITNLQLDTKVGIPLNSEGFDGFPGSTMDKTMIFIISNESLTVFTRFVSNHNWHMDTTFIVVFSITFPLVVVKNIRISKEGQEKKRKVLYQKSASNLLFISLTDRVFSLPLI